VLSLNTKRQTHVMVDTMIRKDTSVIQDQLERFSVKQEHNQHTKYTIPYIKCK
jgi:pentose-5-phosphate-3-epimerase